MVVDVSCGQGHVLALTSEGQVFAWGGNECGQLGVASPEGGVAVGVPIRVAALAGKGILQVRSGVINAVLILPI